VRQISISSVTTSVTFEISSRDAFTPYTSNRCASMSRVDIPRAEQDRISSSICPTRRARLGTICGSNSPLRSRGTVRVTGPFVVDTVFVAEPLREFPLPCPDGSSRS
jgi:hypothetical protein